MDFYDVFVGELIEKKSLAALLYLVNGGRELEFTAMGKQCFISRSGSAKVVSLWVERDEQSFEEMEELLDRAVIDGEPFLSVWKNAEIGILF